MGDKMIVHYYSTVRVRQRCHSGKVLSSGKCSERRSVLEHFWTEEKMVCTLGTAFFGRSFVVLLSIFSIRSMLACLDGVCTNRLS